MTDDPTARLREHRLQVTAQRIAVLQAIADEPHATAETIAAAARTRIGAISRQAVYDALAVMAERGLIRRIELSGSPARFEGRVDDNHHHLVCRTCGLVTDVECAAGAAPCLHPADDHGFAIDEAEVVYWGLCTDCSGGDSPQLASRSTTTTTVQADPIAGSKPINEGSV